MVNRPPEDTTGPEEIKRDAEEREKAAILMREAEEREQREFSPEEAARRELANREMCRRYYLPFVMRFNPDYLAGWVHKDICRRLEKFSDDVANKRSPRLMLAMPPRHGKSLLSSKTFPAWHLGKYPTHEIMCCSYSGALSMTFSRNVRTLLRDPMYLPVFPDTQLDPESQSVEAWLTTAGGGLTSAGVGGAITGKGAHILIIDDPVKNHEDADSATAREAVWNWYTSTAYTRLAPGGGVIVIMTRWHQEDLAGILIEQQKFGGDTWEIINYPAIAEHDEDFRKQGEALHPERYDEAALKKIEGVLPPRDWLALYQQRPTAEDGTYFTRDMIEFYRKEDLPEEHTLRNYSAWDLAIGQKEMNDWSVCMNASMDMREKLYIRSRIKRRMSSEEIVQAMCDNFIATDSDVTGIEKGQIEMSIEPFLQKEIRHRKLYRFYIEKLKPGKRDKILRARSIQGLMQQKRVLFPHPDDAPWVHDLIAELMAFPNGKHDDQVDALAWLGLMLEGMGPRPPERHEKPKSWKDKLAKYITSDSDHVSPMSA